MTVCPKCLSEDVEVTTMGGVIGEQPEYDDVNRATCRKCGHRGTAGDWERIEAQLCRIVELKARVESHAALDRVREFIAREKGL